MRVEKFDHDDTTALRALGFDIADDGESGKLSSVTVDIEIIRPDAEWFYLLNGTVLDTRCFRADLLEAGGIKEEDT